MDGRIEQNDISDGILDDDLSDTSAKDSDVFETDEAIETVEVDESIECSDSIPEENFEFEEDTIDSESEYGESTESIVDIPEDTITEDETVEENEGFSEDNTHEVDESYNCEEEILEDTVEEYDSPSDSEEEFLEDTRTEIGSIYENSTDIDEEKSSNEATETKSNEEQIEVIDEDINSAENGESIDLDLEIQNFEKPDEKDNAIKYEAVEPLGTDNSDEKEYYDNFDTDESIDDEHNDVKSNVKVELQDVNADEVTENGSKTADVLDVGNGEQSLRDRIIHPSLVQTAKIAHNMSDTLKADDEGYKTVKGYRIGKVGHLMNSAVSGIVKLPKGQSMVDKTVIDDVAHSFDVGYAALHPEEKFDFKTPCKVSEKERDLHTFEIEMPSLLYEIDESALEIGNATDQVSNGSEYKARIDVTPINSGVWLDENGKEGVRGESKWCPDDTSVQQELKKFGVSGIEYKNGYPDFTSVSFFGCNLEEDEFFDPDRTQFDGCNFSLLCAIEDDPEFAKLYNFDEGQMEDLESGKTPYGYTWHHDTSENGFMLLVPTSIHQACRHSGGRSSWGGGSKNR